MLKLRKKGVMKEMGSLAVGVASLAIALVVTFLIISQGRAQEVSINSINESDTADWTIGYNATNTLASAVDDIPGWVPLIIIAVVGAVLLGLVRMFK